MGRTKGFRGIISILIFTTGLSGCSAFMPAQEDVTITASEPGATITINDSVVGESPVTVQLARNDSYVITSSSDPLPYEDNRRVSFTGALDIVGTFFFIFPIIGCFTPGFWTIGDTDVHFKKVISAGDGERPAKQKASGANDYLNGN